MTPRRLAAWILWRAGVAGVARRILTRGGRFVVSFHGVASRRYDGVPRAVQPSFCAAELGRALRWIQRRFAFLTPGELLGGTRSGVLLTFDDGYANHAASALPVLEELAAPAVFFVATRHVLEPRDWLPATRERVRRHWAREEDVPEAIARDLYDGMSRRDLERCARHPLVEIGSHTARHPFLTRTDDATLERELTASKRTLEELGGRAVSLFAYPAGDYDLRVARAVQAAGYRAAFAEDPVGVDLPAFEIPRVGLYSCDPPYLAAKLSGLHHRALPPHATFDANTG